MNKKHVLIVWCGRLALTGVLFFFAVSAVLQFLRPDYAFMGTPLSFYLLGPYNGWLHAAFYALAAAILLLAIGCYAGSLRQARTAATLVLFILGAVGVVATALAPTDTNATLTIHGTIHILAAALAFIATSCGMFIQSWRFRQDPALAAALPRRHGIGRIRVHGVVGLRSGPHPSARLHGKAYHLADPAVAWPGGVVVERASSPLIVVILFHPVRQYHIHEPLASAVTESFALHHAAGLCLPAGRTQGIVAATHRSGAGVVRGSGRG